MQRSPKRFHILSRQSLKTIGKYRTVNSIHCAIQAKGIYIIVLVSLIVLLRGLHCLHNLSHGASLHSHSLIFALVYVALTVYDCQMGYLMREVSLKKSDGLLYQEDTLRNHNYIIAEARMAVICNQIEQSPIVMAFQSSIAMAKQHNWI